MFSWYPDAARRAERARRAVETLVVTTGNHPAILDHGSYETAKAAVHAAALGLGLVMGTYNMAAWVVRRQRHLFLNACVYVVFSLWEVRLVAHHLREGHLDTFQGSRGSRRAFRPAEPIAWPMFPRRSRGGAHVSPARAAPTSQSRLRRP